MLTFKPAIVNAALTGVAAVSLIGAVPAMAATFINVDDDANYVFGGTEPGTSATLYLKLTGVNSTTNVFTFSYELTNTSDTLINPSGRVRSFAFDDFYGDGDVTSVARGTTATNAYGFDTMVVDASFPGGSTVYDLCVHDGANGNCNGGGDGLSSGNTAMGTFFLDYAGSGMTSLTLDNFVVRYQSLGLDGRGSGIGSGEEIPDPSGGPVPEPSTWAMMLLGFGAIGYAMRRRRAATPRVRFSFT
jgi:hypothetical protein